MGLKILHLEDNAADAELIRIELEGLDLEKMRVVENKKEYVEALQDGDYDIILSDYNVPDILGLESLEIARSHSLDIPFLYVSGAIGEEGAVEMLKKGASDYVLKSKLEKLPISIERAVQAHQHHQLIEKKEQKIREQQHEYRQLIDQMQEGFIKISEDGTISLVNPSVVNMLGYSKEELLGADAKYVLKLPLHDKSFYSMVETNSFELILTRKNGERFWAHLGITPQFGKSGELLGIVAVTRDISDQKLDEVWKEIVANVSRENHGEDISVGTIFDKLGIELWKQMPCQNFFAAVKTRSNSLRLVSINNTEIENRAMTYASYINDNPEPIWYSGGEVRELETKLSNLEGTKIPEAVICTPIFVGNQLKGIVGLMDFNDHQAYDEFDFQVLKLVSNQLGGFIEKMEDEQDRRHILQLSEDLICIVEKDGSFRYTNPAFKNNLGYTTQDLGQLKAEELLYENDSDTHRLMHKMLNSGRRKLQFESTIKTKNGDLRYISWTAMSYAKEQSFYCIGRDFTEKRNIQMRIEESERRYRGLFQRMNEGLFRSDEKGVILSVNPGFCRILGYKESEIVGKIGYNILHDPATAKHLEKKIKYRMKGKPGLYETSFIHKNGSKVWAQVSSTPDYDSNGEFIGVMSILLDITERKKAEQEALAMKEQFTRQLERKVTERTLELENAQRELAKSLKKEKELGRLKSHFVSTASHQFRTPLSVIQSSMGILSMHIEAADKDASLESFTENFEKIYKRMTEQIQRMTELMDDVLILGKINDGNMPLRMEKQPLVTVCEELLRGMEAFSKGKKINLKITGEPRELLFDKKLLEHALSNIVSNALKYSPEGSMPTVEIDFNGSSSQIKVIDQGIGIPQDELKHLFEPFYRASNAKEYNGTGLGTAIAKEYIELIGGTIEAQSELGKGSQFIIHLKN